tara:strand:+ start:98 stop:643 length:546 start_codon:yes stop_codon:yes gene_type:complete
LDGLTKDNFTDRVNTLSDRAETEFAELGYKPCDLSLDFSMDARYVGQGYELRVPFEPPDVLRGPSRLIERFHELHQRQYGHSFLRGKVEAISFRLTARLPRGSVLNAPAADGDPTIGAERTISLLGDAASYKIYNRDDLPNGFAGAGPAVIVESTTSMPIPPDWHFEVRPGGAVIVTRSDA